MDYSYVFIVIFFVVILAVALMRASGGGERRRVRKSPVYSYSARKLVMSQTESAFFTKLNATVEGRYFVFPQVHLSALLDHRIKGQDWKAAFRHINGKSVDFVLCDRVTLEPVYAVELDDSTHSRGDRVERDIEVERIFTQARLPLVRFKNAAIPSDEIIRALSDAKESIWR